MKKVFICSLILLTLCGCGKTKKIETKEVNKFKKEYESLNGKDSYIDVTIKDNNPIVYSNLDEIIDIIENKSGLIYLGYPESNSCRDSIGILIEAAKQTGLKKVYYLNVKNINADTKSEEQVNKLKKYVSDFEGINVIFVKDKDNIGTISSLDKDYKKMSESELDELLKVYRNSIHEMLNDLCDQSC